MGKERTPNDIILEGVNSGAITKDDATILLDAIYKNRPVQLPFSKLDWTGQPYPQPGWQDKADEKPPWIITSSTDE